jgi:hypothetical protein
MMVCSSSLLAYLTAALLWINATGLDEFRRPRCAVDADCTDEDSTDCAKPKCKIAGALYVWPVIVYRAHARTLGDLTANQPIVPFPSSCYFHSKERSQKSKESYAALLRL